MEEETEIPEKTEKKRHHRKHERPGKHGHKRPRPILLSLLCIFAFVFYGLISLFFLLALFASGWITEVRNKYVTDESLSKQTIILLTLSGFILHLIALGGSITMWYRRKSGYLVFSISTLVIALSQLFFDRLSVFTTAVYIVFILLFGIFYKRFH